MPEKRTLAEARKAKRRGRSPSTQASAFVREEIRHVRRGKHGVRSTRQAIAIGLSKARRAGVALPSPERASPRVKAQAAGDRRRGRHPRRAISKARSRASRARLDHTKTQGKKSVTHKALARQARRAARRRSPADRSWAARRAARTKGPAVRRRAARAAARTRRRRSR